MLEFLEALRAGLREGLELPPAVLGRNDYHSKNICLCLMTCGQQRSAFIHTQHGTDRPAQLDRRFTRQGSRLGTTATSCRECGELFTGTASDLRRALSSCHYL